MSDSKFPKDFFWGASTSSHQVEGDTNNQWTKWEKENAEKLSSTARKKLSWLPNWQAIAKSASDPNNYISANGIEHYSRYKEDFQFLTEMGMNAYRFGIEWSRLEPVKGQWDKHELAHYHEYIAELKAANIEPFVTLWHWALPLWFTDKGGFSKRENIKYFVNYAKRIAKEFGDEIRYVIILNEPNVYTGFSYLAGAWPPQKVNPLAAYRVYRNLAIEHNEAYIAIKKLAPEINVGIAAQLSDARASHPSNPVNAILIKSYIYIGNWWFLDRIKDSLDFIGLNYYFTEYRNWWGKTANPKSPINDLGWYMEPSGIYPLLIKLWNRYKKPIIITENGLADAKDTHRQWWLQETIQALQKALADGVDLRGYLHWSLLDNFEWAYGWWPKFGLVAVDRETMRRTLRPSAKWLAKTIKTTCSKK